MATTARAGRDRGARFAGLACDPQDSGALLGVQVGYLEGEGFADPQAAQQDGE